MKPGRLPAKTLESPSKERTNGSPEGGRTRPARFRGKQGRVKGRWRYGESLLVHAGQIVDRFRLPTGRRLRDMVNCFVFCIEGYDDDPREIHSIPEIRRFYSSFHKRWPYWLYFCNLETDNLKTMTLCSLPTLTALKVDGVPKVAVTHDRLELMNFLARDFLPMNAMCERAEMFERLIYDRTRAVFEYFGLPFDAEPPCE